MARWAKRIAAGLMGLLLLLVIAALMAVGPGNIGRMAFGMGITYDNVPPELPTLDRPAILIFSKTNGFRDGEQIAAANAALEDMASENGWSYFTSENAALFNPRDLVQFDLVVWNNVSGDVLTAEQRSAFRAWLEQGGGFVGLHGAGGDPSYAWQWYVDQLIGAQFSGHTLAPQYQSARLVIEDHDHPATAHLGTEWVRTDEWYSFASNPRDKGSRILISIDEQSYSPTERIPLLVNKDLRMGDDHPLVWTHCVGDGRAFYSALGHQASAYAEPDHLNLIGGAIAWAAGLEGPTCNDGQEVATSSPENERSAP